MKNRGLILVITLLAIAAITLGVLHVTNNARKTQQIDELNDVVAERDTTIKSLQADVADRDAAIQTLTADAEAKNAQVISLIATTSDLKGQIANLTTEVETLTAEVTDKSAQLEGWIATATDLETQVDELTQEVQTLRRTLYGETEDDSSLNVTITEFGFQSTGSGYLYYSFTAHNELENEAVYLPEFRITAYNANGDAIEAKSQVLNVIYPGQDTRYAGLFGMLEDVPAAVEITYVKGESWQILTADQLEQAVYVPIEVRSAQVSESSSSIVGEIYNPNDYSVSIVAVTAMFRDADGNPLAGDTTYIDGMPAGETVTFEVPVSEYLMTDTVEVFAQPWM